MGGDANVASPGDFPLHSGDRDAMFGSMAIPLLPLLVPFWVLMIPEPGPSLGPMVARARLGEARTMVVQYQRLEPGRIAEADPDLLILDASRDGSRAGEWTREEVARLKARRGGGSRLLLAYLSIGEAEEYRSYWPRDGSRPPYAGPENPAWPGNFRVRHWTPAWHRVIYDSPDSLVERLVARGYDGVFLDTVDSCESWQREGRGEACREMGALIHRLGRRARALRPDFILVGNNPFPVLDRPEVQRALTGWMSENRLFRQGRMVRGRELERLLEPIRAARRRGTPVLVLEYPPSSGGRRELRALCRREGLLCQASTPALDTIGHILDPGCDTQEAP